MASIANNDAQVVLVSEFHSSSNLGTIRDFNGIRNIVS